MVRACGSFAGKPMPAPTSVSEFLDLTQRSGVVDEIRLNAYVRQLREGNALPTEPSRLAGMMVRDCILTYFQAQQLLMGKWKRFSIGRYKVLEKIGAGGMGQVFLCEHKLMRRRVAVKVLTTAKAGESSALERFHREARAVAALDHPNIVRAYDIDQDENLHFLIMEFVDGSNLQDIVKKTGPMSALRACHYAYQTALGLQHAFDRAGLIHRDIKPGNILVDRTGVVKILDMGLARFFDDEDDLLTKKFDETVLGTADYLAPEQALDSHSVDIRADIYSLGATFYFLLTGNPPFADGTVTQKLLWHQQKEPKPVTEYRQDVPDAVIAILKKMMAKDPNSRYRLPVEVANALTPYVNIPIAPPADCEMPRLSPAALGTTGGTPNPDALTTSAGNYVPVQASPEQAARTDFDRAPAVTTLLYTSTAGQLRVPSAAEVSAELAVPPKEDLSPVWSQLVSETPSPIAAAETSVARPVYRPPSTTIRRKHGQQVQLPRLRSVKKKWLILACATAAALVIVSGIGVAVAVSGAKTAPAAAPSGSAEVNTPSTFVVDASAPAQGLTVHRVYQAIARAKTGDRILVRTNVYELWNIDWKRLRGVSIEADATTGRPIVWRLPAEIKAQKSILDLTHADGVKIKGFVFDGESKADHGIYMAFHCPGVVVEDVHFVNCNKSGVMLGNAAGDSNRPITLQRLRLSSRAQADAGISMFARANFTPAQIQFVRIQDCLIEGSTAALLIDGPIDAVTIAANRIFRGTNGVHVKAKATDAKTNFTVRSNTFHGLSGHAVFFDAAPSGIIAVEKNYIANCAAVCGVKDNKPYMSLVATGNARNTATPEGSIRINARVIDYHFPVLDPNAGRDFLRYPAHAPLANVEGSPVGAPPDE